MICDHLAGFELTDEMLAPHQNEVRALRHLWVGLEFLNGQVLALEDAMAQRLDPSMRSFIYGNHPLLADLPMELLTCVFHWYAVSSCNFVRLIGWLRQNADAASPSPGRYVEAVLPQVLPWRNKIAAHFARADTRDEEAERLASVFPPIGFNDARFVASPMTLNVWRGRQHSSSEALQPWSLTAVHAGLHERYFPTTV